MQDTLSMLSQSFVQFIGTVFLQEFHIVLLQGVALVGIVSMVVVSRGRLRFRTSLPELLGVGFGIAAFLMFLFMMLQFWTSGYVEDVRRFLKPFLRNDLLFLAGFFGGLAGAGYALFFVALARYLLGPTADLLISFLDMLLITCGAVMIRMSLPFYDLARITVPQIALLLLAKLVVVLFPLVLLIVLGVRTFEEFSHLMFGRVMTTMTVSILVFYTLIMLLRREIICEQLLYYDSDSGLPNRKALQERIERIIIPRMGFGRKQPAVMLLVNVVNFKSLIQDNGHDYLDALLASLGQRARVFCNNLTFRPIETGIYFFSEHLLAIVIEGVDMAQIRAHGVALNLHAVLVHEEQHKTLPHKVWVTIGVVEVNGATETGSHTPQWFLRGLTLIEPVWSEPVQYFDSSIALQAETEYRIRAKIEEWVYAGQVPLWFQPKMNLVTLQCFGAEAL